MLGSKVPDEVHLPTTGGISPRHSSSTAAKTPSLCPGDDPVGERTAWRWFPLALLALAAASLAVDCSVAQWFPHRNYPRLLAELIQLSEVFGHGLGVLVLAIVIYHLDVGRRRALPRLLLCSLGAGMAANGVKMFIARTRPRFFEFDGDVTATFSGWLPLGRGGASLQSFPSAHTATAFGLAIGLAWLYPRGRRVFGILAILVACQRMQSNYHYLSDVLIGAAVGIVVARAFIGPGWLSSRIERLEGRWKPRATDDADSAPARREYDESESHLSRAA